MRLTRTQALVTLEYVRPGKGATFFDELLLVDLPEVKVLLLERAPGDVTVDGKPILERGAPIVWFIFPGQWQDVGRFHLADGTFTGWYTNLCTPVLMQDDRWSVTDLFLDLWMPATGAPTWLDENEFEEAIARGTLSPDLAGAARDERARIDSLVARNDWPPGVCHTWDLKSALASLSTAR